jgi:hypothetical protein
LSTTLSKIWLSVGPFFRSFDHNFLVSRPFWARQVSNRSSHYVLQNGPGAVSSIQLSVWSTVRSNFGQTWSTLVEFGQNSPNSGKRIPDRVSRVFWARWTLVRLGTARSNLGQTSVNPGQTWSTLVKLGQPWSNLVNPGQTLGNVSRTFSLGVFDTTRLRWIMRAGSGSPRLACRHPRKSRG